MFDAILDEKLAGIRARQDSGQINLRQAADERVAALEQHIEAIKALRAEFFGETETPC